MTQKCKFDKIKYPTLQGVFMYEVNLSKIDSLRIYRPKVSCITD